AKAIKSEKEIKTSKQLAEIVSRVASKNYERGRIHPATRTFQALRIYANGELNNLENALKKIPEILKPNGRAVIISFHSLEDKLVKNYFKNYSREKIIEILTKKPIKPTREEVKNNPNSRSAKLRAARII
ncbi:MAG: 16S rRNA (cytosine(1402)-N(4))-methyltransferase, partial [bacterium]|nr:16S rRNA (cytosine(1402)-N(4))-methyltransferase [bacterium]